MTDTPTPIGASAFGGNEPIANVDGSFCIPTTAPEARTYLANLRKNADFVDILCNPLDGRHAGYGQLVKSLEMVGQRDRADQVAYAETNRLAENARREKAEAAPLAEKLGIYFPVRS